MYIYTYICVCVCIYVYMYIYIYIYIYKCTSIQSPHSIFPLSSGIFQWSFVPLSPFKPSPNTTDPRTQCEAIVLMLTSNSGTRHKEMSVDRKVS